MADDLILHQKPKNIILAIRLLWGSLVLGILSDLFIWEFIISQMQPDSPMMDKDMFLLCWSLFITAVTIWGTLKTSSGRNWARIFLLIMFIVLISIAIPTYIALFKHSKLLFLISVIQFIPLLIAFYFLFSKTGNAWFKAQKELKKKI